MTLPILTIAVLFCAVVFLSIVSIATDRNLRAAILGHWKILALLVLATAVWRIPTNGGFFHGLEYEDSYVYTVAGRQLAEGSIPSADGDAPFSISTCEIGSMRSCQKWESFPEHYMGYPYVIGEVSRLFGYTPSVGSIINLLASLFSVLLVFSIALSITADPVSASIAGFIFAAVPVFAVYGLETSAEPFSSLCILLTLWFYLRLCDDDEGTWLGQVVAGLGYCAALCFSLTVKRENILLAVVLPIMLPFAFSGRKVEGRSRSRVIALVIVASGLALLLIAKMHLFHTSEGEMELLRQFPLTLSRLAQFVRSFLSSFAVLRWYGGTILAVAFGMVVAFIKRGRYVVPVILLAAYILLYTSHIRGYYEMQSGHVEARSALRFSMNVMGLWSIVAGVGLGALIKWFRTRPLANFSARVVSWGAVTICVAALIISLLATLHLRNETVDDEARSRLAPAAAAIRLAEDGGEQADFIITMEPLVVQMYGSPQSRVVDLEAAEVADLKSLSDSGQSMLFVRETDRVTDVDLGRYGDPLRYMLALPSRVLVTGDGYEIVLSVPTPSP